MVEVSPPPAAAREAMSVYQTLFNAITAATKIEGGHVSITVSAFQAAIRALPLPERLALIGVDAATHVLVPNATHMLDEQAEAIAREARCCGGIAYDIYRAALSAAEAATDGRDASP